MPEVQHISGSAGGYLIGNSHANGGIKAINKSIGKPLEMEGGEVVITEPAVSDTETINDFNGQKLTNRQVLSAINVKAGGVDFAELGMELPTEMYCSGLEYELGGQIMTDYNIVHRVSKCGYQHDDDKFADGGAVEKIKDKKFKEGFAKIKHFVVSDFGGAWEYIHNPNMSTSGRKKGKTYTISPTKEQTEASKRNKDNYEKLQPKEISILDFAKKVSKNYNAKIFHKSNSGSVYLRLPTHETLRISDHYILDRNPDNPKNRHDYEIVQKDFSENDLPIIDGFEEKFEGGGIIQINSQVESLIKKIKDEGKYFKGNIQTNQNGISYRFDEYKLEYPDNEIVKQFKKIVEKEYGSLSLSNSYDFRKINLEGNRLIHADLPKYKNQKTNFIVFRELVKQDSEKFKNGGITENNEPINLYPNTIEEFEQSLRMAVDQDLDKNQIFKIQSHFFQIVQENPHKLLGPYYSALDILPKSKREYYQYVVSGTDDDFMEDLHENPYNLLPDAEKKEIEVKKLDFSPTPKSENLGKIMNLFTAEDNLRPRLCGVFFNVKEERIEATNAHTLMFINEKPHLSESMICMIGKRKEWYLKHVQNESPIAENDEGCWRVDDSYVNTSQIIPTDFYSIIEIDAKKLLQYLNAAWIFSNQITRAVIICYKKEDSPRYLALNYNFLSDCLKGMLMLGHEQLEMCFMEAKNRPVCIVPKGNSRKISGYSLKTDVTLTMPIMTHHVEYYGRVHEYSAVYDIQNNIATIPAKYDGTFIEPIEIEETPNINKLENSDNIQTIENSTSSDNLKNTISGLEILLESAKGKNKTNLLKTISGLKLLTKVPEFEKGGETDKNPLEFRPIETPL